MATAYHVENIERITEQMLEEEVLEETEDIRVDAINNIGYIKEQGVSFITEQKRDLIIQFSDIRNKLQELDDDTDVIYKNTIKIAGDTENTIEKDIRSMIVEKGYKLVLSNDGHGNVTEVLKVVE